MRSGLHPLTLAVFAVVAALAALVVVIALTGKPSDGDPVVSLKLAPLPEPTPPPAAPPQAETGGTRVLNGNLVADAALIEQGPAGPLPSIAADGRKPMDAYARSFDRTDTRPRIAVVIGGLGLSAQATQHALETLPPAITVSFAPYASDIQHWVDAARAAGHEVLIEVPMEPLGFPQNNPGPHTLMVRARANENTQRLAWTLSRFTGYVGITNLLGARFLGDAHALGPVLIALRQRGLIMVDNGGAPHSVVSETAQRLHAASIGATLVLDEIQEREAIQAKLAELELRARERGAAVGSGFLYPLTIQEITEWAATLESRGFAPAPITAAVARPDTSSRK